MIILRQCEFTSIPRKLGAKLKRGRINVAEWVGKVGIQNPNNKRLKTGKELSGYAINNPKLLKESIKNARDNYNARTLGAERLKVGSSNISSTRVKQMVKEYGDEIDSSVGRKVGNAFRKGKNIILLKKRGGNYDVFEHAHEVGHLENNRVGSKNNQIFQSLEPGLTQDSLKTAKNLKTGPDKGLGLKEYWKRLKEGRVMLKEESQASKNAMKFLKEHGATEEEIKMAKDKARKALDTYKDEAKIYRRLPLQNSLLPETRRRK